MSEARDPIGVSVLTTPQALAAWPLIAPFIEKAIPYAAGRITLESTRDYIAAGKALAIVVWDQESKAILAVMTAEALDFPRKRVFAITLCGGEQIDRWGHIYPALKQIAVNIGFDQIDVSGRAGWKKFLPGATEIGRTFVENLAPARDVELVHG